MSTRPKRRCVEHPCPHPVHARGRCLDHQPPPWQGATPDKDRPSGRAWRKLRAAILERDAYICYVCHKAGADQVDHIRNIGEGGARWAPENLAAIHEEPCHKLKTQREAKRGKERQKRLRKRGNSAER